MRRSNGRRVRGYDSRPSAPTAPARDYGVLALDPGGTVGWCLVHPDGSFDAGEIDTHTPDWRETVRRMVSTGVRVVIEGVTDGTVTLAHCNRALSLLVTRLYDLMEICAGAVVRTVNPVEWQRKYLRLGGGWSLDTKERSMRAVQRLTGKRIRSAHACDAVLVALWAMESGAC